MKVHLYHQSHFIKEFWEGALYVLPVRAHGGTNLKYLQALRYSIITVYNIYAKIGTLEARFKLRYRAPLPPSIGIITLYHSMNG